ncbi:probable gluconokinase isoform X3 [Balaenoptera acutorostrata]|uniref:gluconokinase n=1 Tax=Balaenoptera acutorostrata TaxID=9767 RepID=A0A383ZPD7_BALAC|nr:probable gluconokinase isoform X3 [Balaenoptera acutorostrata]
MAASGALLVMGVSGSGKSTVGALLASQLGWKFYDADDYHPEENRMKMAKGIPLNDQDRIPWLCNLHDILQRRHIQANGLREHQAISKRAEYKAWSSEVMWAEGQEGR